MPFLQRRFTTPRSDQTPVPGSAALLWGANTEFAGAGPGAAHAAGCNPKSALYKQVSPRNTPGAIQHARLAAFWTVAGVLGTLAVFPYALAINPTLVAQLPLRAAGAVLVLAPAVARCTSCITCIGIGPIARKQISGNPCDLTFKQAPVYKPTHPWKVRFCEFGYCITAEH